MKKQITKIVLAVFIAGAVFTSCKKDKVEENESEVITTLMVTLTPVTGPALEFKYDDVDGPGGAAATSDEIKLAPNMVYQVALKLLDKTKMPVSDVTEEVISEKDDHQFYITPNGGANLTVSNLSKDSKNFPFGQTSTWTTGAVSTGKVFIVLKHKPGGIKGANDAISVGETDIDTEEAFGGFVLKIQ